MISGPTPRGLRGWGFFDSICDMTLLIRPPNFFNMAENNKTNIFRKRRFCTFIWCNELIHVSYRKNMKNPESNKTDFFPNHPQIREQN